MGHYVPNTTIKNNDFIEMGIETTDEWIQTRTGIKERRQAAPTQRSSDLACEAAKIALNKAGLSADDLSGIIVATATPDNPGFPSTACIIQEKLGIQNTSIMAFDVTAACSGFNYALTTAQQYIQTGMAKHILVVGVDCLSEITDWKDRGTCILFGDGAGAVILGPVESDMGILYSKLFSNGALADSLKVSFPAPGDQKGTLEADRPFIEMDGKAVFKTAVAIVGPAIQEGLDALGLSKDDVDWVVLHQANQRIIDAVQKKIGVPKEKMVSNIAQYGNTSAASIPLALGEWDQNGQFKKDHIVICCGFGAGFTWGVNIIRWSQDTKEGD